MSPTPARPGRSAGVLTPRSPVVNNGSARRFIRRPATPRHSFVRASPLSDYEEEADTPQNEIPFVDYSSQSSDGGFDPNDSLAFNPVDVRHAVSPWAYAERPEVTGTPAADIPFGLQHPDVDGLDELMI